MIFPRLEEVGRQRAKEKCPVEREREGVWPKARRQEPIEESFKEV